MGDKHKCTYMCGGERHSPVLERCTHARKVPKLGPVLCNHFISRCYAITSTSCSTLYTSNVGPMEGVSSCTEQTFGCNKQMPYAGCSTRNCRIVFLVFESLPRTNIHIYIWFKGTNHHPVQESNTTIFWSWARDSNNKFTHKLKVSSRTLLVQRYITPSLSDTYEAASWRNR